jgi:hypothetical protein
VRHNAKVQESRHKVQDTRHKGLKFRMLNFIENTEFQDMSLECWNLRLYK